MTDNINVDTEVLYSAYPAIDAEMKKLMTYADGLSRNVGMAAVKFDSENFRRASEILSAIRSNLEQSAVAVAKLKPYFEKLRQCADEYLSSKW